MKQYTKIEDFFVVQMEDDIKLKNVIEITVPSDTQYSLLIELPKLVELCYNIVNLGQVSKVLPSEGGGSCLRGSEKVKFISFDSQKVELCYVCKNKLLCMIEGKNKFPLSTINHLKLFDPKNDIDCTSSIDLGSREEVGLAKALGIKSIPKKINLNHIILE